jgi:hypothetical protein
VLTLSKNEDSAAPVIRALCTFRPHGDDFYPLQVPAGGGTRLWRVSLYLERMGHLRAHRCVIDYLIKTYVILSEYEQNRSRPVVGAGREIGSWFQTTVTITHEHPAEGQHGLANPSPTLLSRWSRPAHGVGRCTSARACTAEGAGHPYAPAPAAANARPSHAAARWCHAGAGEQAHTRLHPAAVVPPITRPRGHRPPQFVDTVALVADDGHLHPQQH